MLDKEDGCLVVDQSETNQRDPSLIDWNSFARPSILNWNVEGNAGNQVDGVVSIHYIRVTIHSQSRRLLKRALEQLKDRRLMLETRISVRERDIFRKGMGSKL